MKPAIDTSWQLGQGAYHAAYELIQIHSASYKSIQKAVSKASHWVPPIHQRLLDFWLLYSNGLKIYKSFTNKNILILTSFFQLICGVNI